MSFKLKKIRFSIFSRKIVEKESLNGALALVRFLICARLLRKNTDLTYPNRCLSDGAAALDAPPLLQSASRVILLDPRKNCAWILSPYMVLRLLPQAAQIRANGLLAFVRFLPGARQVL